MATGDEVAQHAAGLVQQHIAWLERLENRMLSMEVDLATMTPTVDRLDNEFFNHNGEKGLKTLFLEHAAEQRQVRAMREEADRKANEAANRRSNVIIACMAVLGALLSLLLYLHTIEDTRKGLLKIPHLYAPAPLGQVYAKSETAPQDAGLPSAYDQNRGSR
jgi:hypothetical protein